MRSKIVGSSEKPRISVFRSNRYIYAQAVDDRKKVTLCAFSNLKLKTDKETASKDQKTQQSRLVGVKLAKFLKNKGIKKAVFDRSVYAYHGRVAALADGLREGGIQI